MRYRTRVFVLLGAATLPLAAVSTAAAQSRAERQMNADIRILQEQTQQLQVLVTTLTDALEVISQKLDEQAGVNRRTFADLRLITDNISGDVRIVREKIDETNVRLASFDQEVQAIQLSIQTLQLPPPPLEGDPTVTEDGAVAAGPSSVLPPRPTPVNPPGVSPGRMYDTAHGDYMSGQYSLAIQGFEAFLRTFPTLPDAASAQYYIGEAYRSDGQDDAALTAYDKVLADYPDSSVVADALYRRGDLLQKRGQLDAAKSEYERVITDYPDSSPARLARQRLDGLLNPRQ